MLKKETFFEFQAIGQAIKEARTNRKITREKLAEKLGIAVRYLAEIENKGQHPSFQVFYELVTTLDISVDQFFYPANKPIISTKRRQVNTLLNGLNDNELVIIEATANGISKTKTAK